MGAPSVLRDDEGMNDSMRKIENSSGEKPASSKPLERSHDGRGGGIRTHNLFVPKLLREVSQVQLQQRIFEGYAELVGSIGEVSSKDLSEKIMNFRHMFVSLCHAYAPQPFNHPKV